MYGMKALVLVDHKKLVLALLFRHLHKVNTGAFIGNGHLLTDCLSLIILF